MARQIRIEYPGALYHVACRGNARQVIFVDNRDRRAFLRVLRQTADRCHWLCHAYCLMGNHYHLLVETPEANLSVGMRQLNGVYSQAFNRRHERVGHLFQGRYKAILVERDSYLLELSRYIVLNPVRARLVGRPEDYPWSSFAACLGKAPVPAFLVVDWLLGQFAGDRRAATEAYAGYVREGIGRPGPWSRLKGGAVLGGDGFVAQVRRRLSGSEELTEVPRAQRFVGRPALSDLLAGHGGAGRDRRNRRVCRAHAKFGYSQSEIARFLGLHYSTVSRIIKETGSGLES